MAMSEGVTLDQLRILIAVAEEGSFTAAARRLGHVQAAVSQAMQRLEAELGLRLFDRSGREARLTTRGAAILAEARSVCASAERLEGFAKQLRGGMETELGVVVDSMFPPEALVRLAQDLAERFPSIELRIHTETLSGVGALVRERRATLGVAGTDTDLTQLEATHVVDVRMIPVVARSHPLAQVHGEIGAEALSSHRQIVLRDRAEEGPLAANTPGLLSPKTWRVVDVNTKHDLIVGGLGWGHEPEHLVRGALRDGSLVHLHLAAWGSHAPSRSLSLVKRAKTVLGPVAEVAARRLTALCKAAVEGQPIT